MTQLLSTAFDYVKEEIAVPKEGKAPKRGAVLLIDEADALAQSREMAQMHHEDRAGVNALIRGIDAVAVDHRPVIVVMCSNRSSAIDPAIQRRAAEIFTFSRPNTEQRATVLAGAFHDSGLTDQEIAKLAELTGPTETRDYRYTFSDLTTGLSPQQFSTPFPTGRSRSTGSPNSPAAHRRQLHSPGSIARWLRTSTSGKCCSRNRRA
jgi:ATPase family associated with various cellular activities (AAA)